MMMMMLMRLLLMLMLILCVCSCVLLCAVLCNFKDLLIWASPYSCRKTVIRKWFRREKKSFIPLNQKTFGLFGIKITAQLPIDDSGLCFISVLLLLPATFLNSKKRSKREKKKKKHKKLFVCLILFYSKETFYSQLGIMKRRKHKKHTNTHSLTF